jgi:hypothetical protein
LRLGFGEAGGVKLVLGVAPLSKASVGGALAARPHAAHGAQHGLVATARTVGDIDGDAPARARELFVVPVWADRSFHALLLRAERAGIMRRVRELEKIHLVCGAAVLCVHTRTDEGVKRGRQVRGARRVCCRADVVIVEPWA